MTFVDDDELPPEHEWVVVTIDGDDHLIVKRTADLERVVADVRRVRPACVNVAGAA